MTDRTLALTTAMLFAAAVALFTVIDVILPAVAAARAALQPIAGN